MRLAWFLLAAILVMAPVAWLVGDALYARRMRMLANAPAARRAATEPIALNPRGYPALLLLHGFADGPAVFAEIAPPLAAAGFAVRAPHLSGSGAPPAQSAGLTLAVWRGEIDREIAALCGERPDRPVWLVGHSLGGTLAFDAALRPTNRIAGLVLLAPLLDVSRARSPILAPRQWFRLLDRLLVFTDVIESRLPADLHDLGARPAYRTDKYIHRAVYRALFAAMDAVQGRAAEWRGPLLTIVSPSDQIVETAATRFFFAATNAAPARLTEQYSAGHVIPLDTGHEIVAAKIVRFIRETPHQP